MTEQQYALRRAKQMFGNTAFTEHHINYFRVGFKQAGKVIMAMGDSWEEVLLVLDKKRGM